MGEIFHVDENDVPWAEYAESGGEHEQAAIRYKALTMHNPEVPPVQYVEYAPGHADPVHRHKTGEYLIVTDGELLVGDSRNGPGSIVFIPRDTDYSVCGGDAGVRFFRVVMA